MYPLPVRSSFPIWVSYVWLCRGLTDIRIDKRTKLSRRIVYTERFWLFISCVICYIINKKVKASENVPIEINLYLCCLSILFLMVLSKAELTFKSTEMNANILRNVHILPLTFATVRIVFITAIIIIIVHTIISHRIKITRKSSRL